MKATLSGVLLCTVGAFSVLLQGCGGSSGTSGGGSGNSNNPVPSITSLSPTSAPQGGSAFTLTVTGSGFISSSQVQWKGSALSTAYQSASSLTVQVPSGNLSAMGSFGVTVVNTSPGGGTSNSVVFTVGNPVPALTSISPTTVPAGNATFTLTATGSNFVTGSLIQWNGTALATTFVSNTQLTAQVPAADVVSGGAGAAISVIVVNPSPNGGSSNAAQFTIAPPTTHIVEINLPANDIAWDSTHARIYASLPSTDTNGNSVVAIDPVTATVGTPLAVGSEPHPLALSTDNSFLYLGLDGTGQIKRINLPALTLDTSLNLQLPVDQFFGQQVALSLAVAPGSPHTIAASLGSYAWSPETTGGTVVYDDAVPRANVVSFSDATDSSVEWGADATALYGIDAISSGNDLYVMSVNSSGISLTSDYGYLVPTQYGRLHFDSGSGHIYVDGGRVVDPGAGNVVSTFNMGPLSGYQSPLCALDLPSGLVFFLGQTVDQFNASSGVLIEAFDATTHNLVGSLPIPGVTGHPIQFLRWGSAGLAFNMSTASSSLLEPVAGPIYLVDGPFVNANAPADFVTGSSLPVAPGLLSSISPQSATAGSADTTLTVTGSNFDTGASITWNGTALQTTLTSSTALQATIPAADLASAGTAIVSVSDSNSGLRASNSQAFTILAASSGTTNLSAINLASLDLAWDAKDSLLIVPVWSADPQHANSVLAIDPSAGSITKSVSVASDPDLVRVTDDDSTIYTGFRTINAVSTLALPNLTAGYSWSLGADPFAGPYYAYDLQPAPGAPGSVALAFAVNGSEPPQTNGMTIYDTGVARSVSTSKNIGFQNIQWSATNTTLYATDDASNLYNYAVDSTGLTQQSRQMITNGTTTLGNIHFDAGTGYLYDDDGDVIDPATNTITGSLGASGLVIPDSSLNRIFLLGQLTSQTGTSNYTIQAFDQQKLSLVHSLTLNALIGTPVAFIRWGTNGLALVTYNQTASTTDGPAGMLYILSDSSFVSANVVPAPADSNRELVHAFPRVRPHLQPIGAAQSLPLTSNRE